MHKRSKRYQEYLQYLDSPHWAMLRKQAFARDGNKCQKCGSVKRLQGHHLKYRQDLTACTVDDIQTLCDSCHKEHHKIKSHRRRLKREPNLVRLICKYSADENPPQELNYANGKKKPLRNRTQKCLASQAWFVEAIKLPRKKFRKLVRAEFEGMPEREKFLSNAFILYDSGIH